MALCLSLLTFCWRLAMIGHLLFDFSVSYWHAVFGGVRVVAVEKSNFRVLFLPFWSASSPSLFREVGFFAFKFACGLLEKLSPVARFVIVVKVALRLFAASWACV